MKWRTGSTAILEKTMDDVSEETICETRRTPRVVNITYNVRVEFLLLEDPIFEYDAFFSEDRSIYTLADEQKRSREDFGKDLQDVELPPDVD